MQENPFAVMEEQKGRQGTAIDLLPYLNTSIFNCLIATAYFVTNNIVCIDIYNLTSTSSGYDDVLFSNLPFNTTGAAASFVFVDPRQAGSFSDANKALIYTAGTSLLCHHPATSSGLFGQLIAKVA